MTADQLRKSILQQAIQGKLVPQDLNDEPASALLERIREEKARLVKEKKAKREKNPSMIFRGEDNSYYEEFPATGEVKCIDDEIPFDLPDGWAWAKIGDLFHHNNGKQLNKGNSQGTLMSYITTSNLYWDGFKLENLKSMPFTDREVERCQAVKGDLLVCEGGDIGRSCIWMNDYPIMLQNHIHKLRAYLPICTKYFYYIFYLYNLSGIIGGKGIGIQGFSSQALHITRVPLPPLAEQERIVAKIEELMPWVEQYGKAQSELDQLNNSIQGRLRKSVLQYAIEGKLVPQQAEDGSAEELLAEIQAEKQRLYVAGKLKKKDLAHSSIFRTEDGMYYEQVEGDVVDITTDIPFDILEGWSWCRLKSICAIFTGATFKKGDEKTNSQGIRILRGGNILPFEITFKADDIFLPCNLVKEDILLQRNDIVTPAVTSLENIGKMARIKDDLPNVTVGGFVFVLRLYYSNDWLSKYLLALMSSPTMIEYMKSITNKSGQAFYNIGKERLATMLLPIPPHCEQQRIVRKLEEVLGMMNRLGEQS